VAFIIAAPPVLARLFRRLLGSLLLCLCLLLFLLPLPLLVELLLKVGKLQRIVENPLPLTRNRVYGLGFRVGKLQRIVENPLPLTRNRAWISHWPRMAAAGLYYTGLGCSRSCPFDTEWYMNQSRHVFPLGINPGMPPSLGNQKLTGSPDSPHHRP